MLVAEPSLPAVLCRAVHNTTVGAAAVQVSQAEVLIEERDEEIRKVVETIAELAQIMRDLSTLVVEQGTMLDRIDTNITQAAVKVRAGLARLCCRRQCFGRRMAHVAAFQHCSASQPRRARDPRMCAKPCSWLCPSSVHAVSKSPCSPARACVSFTAPAACCLPFVRLPAWLPRLRRG